MTETERKPHSSVLGRQKAFNRRTRNSGSLYLAHRRVVTEVIVWLSQVERNRLCVLGAGNANDLDLPVLAQAFGQIHLVDLDSEALSEVARRHPELGGLVTLHGDTDLSGIAARLDALSRPLLDRAVDLLIDSARRVSPPRIGGRFDVVASTCLLTQLLHSAAAALGGHSARLSEAFEAIRIGHLRLLADLTAPGGAGLLVTDLASSDDAPEIATAHERDLPALATRLAAAGACFAGIDLGAMEDQLSTDLFFASNVQKVRRLGVWRWRINKTKTFLVGGLSFIKCE
ncbi:MAG: hypothetical protein OXB98_16140 [Bryobacterales bacterium]|nr:hypothetical protein [Bryobacterales bacterium]